MKPYKNLLLGIGTGIFLGAFGTFYAVGMGTGEEKIRPYNTTEKTIENHRGREDLSFFEKRYFFQDDEASEIVFCYPEKGKETDNYCLLLIQKWQDGTREEAKPGSSCSECHQEHKMPLPLGPADPVEIG